eukprot:18318-Heterococcus_DN1.PRE.5
MTPVTVIGVPVQTKALNGVDSLYSIVQMPRGVPVATVAIGNAMNAGLLAVRMLGATDPALQQKMLLTDATAADSTQAVSVLLAYGIRAHYITRARITDVAAY